MLFTLNLCEHFALAQRCKHSLQVRIECISKQNLLPNELWLFWVSISQSMINYNLKQERKNCLHAMLFCVEPTFPNACNCVAMNLWINRKAKGKKNHSSIEFLHLLQLHRQQSLDLAKDTLENLISIFLLVVVVRRRGQRIEKRKKKKRENYCTLITHSVWVVPMLSRFNSKNICKWKKMLFE